MKTFFWCDLQKNIFVWFCAMTGRHFCPDFEGFCPDFQGFCTDFQGFFQIFIKSRLLGVRLNPCTPAFYTTARKSFCCEYNAGSWIGK